MRHYLLNSVVPLVLAVIGTAALIYSWSYEKQELARAYEEVNRLQRSQLVIDTDEVARDQWIIALNQEIGKSKPNQDVLAVTARGALVTLVRWQSHMEMRVAKSSAEYTQTIATREAIVAQAHRYADAKDYSGLVKMLKNIQENLWASNSTSHLDDAFFAQVDEANAKVAEIEATMRWCYIAGTAALLLSSVLSNLLLDRSFRRNTNQIMSLTEAITRSLNRKKK